MNVMYFTVLLAIHSGDNHIVMILIDGSISLQNSRRKLGDSSHVDEGYCIDWNLCHAMGSALALVLVSDIDCNPHARVCGNILR